MQIANIIIGIANLILSGVIFSRLLKADSKVEELDMEHAQLFFEQTTNEEY